MDNWSGQLVYSVIAIGVGGLLCAQGKLPTTSQNIQLKKRPQPQTLSLPGRPRLASLASQ